MATRKAPATQYLEYISLEELITDQSNHLQWEVGIRVGRNRHESALAWHWFLTGGTSRSVFFDRPASDKIVRALQQSLEEHHDLVGSISKTVGTEPAVTMDGCTEPADRILDRAVGRNGEMAVYLRFFNGWFTVVRVTPCNAASTKIQMSPQDVAQLIRLAAEAYDCLGWDMPKETRRSMMLAR